MRMTQFIGLSPRAEEYLQENCALDFVRTHHNLALIDAYDTPRIVRGRHQWYGMYEDGGVLPGYVLNVLDHDERYGPVYNKIVYEKVQVSPWSSGPMIFTMLVDEDGTPVVYWTAKEINDASGEELVDEQIFDEQPPYEKENV